MDIKVDLEQLMFSCGKKSAVQQPCHHRVFSAPASWHAYLILIVAAIRYRCRELVG